MYQNITLFYLDGAVIRVNWHWRLACLYFYFNLSTRLCILPSRIPKHMLSSWCSFCFKWMHYLMYVNWQRTLGSLYFYFNLMIRFCILPSRILKHMVPSWCRTCLIIYFMSKSSCEVLSFQEIINVWKQIIICTCKKNKFKRNWQLIILLNNL